MRRRGDGVGDETGIFLSTDHDHARAFLGSRNCTKSWQIVNPKIKQLFVSEQAHSEQRRELCRARGSQMCEVQRQQGGCKEGKEGRKRAGVEWRGGKRRMNE